MNVLNVGVKDKMTPQQTEEYYRMKLDYDDFKESRIRTDKNIKAFMKSMGKSRMLQLMKDLGYIKIDYVSGEIK